MYDCSANYGKRSGSDTWFEERRSGSKHWFLIRPPRAISAALTSFERECSVSAKLHCNTSDLTIVVRDIARDSGKKSAGNGSFKLVWSGSLSLQCKFGCISPGDRKSVV